MVGANLSIDDDGVVSSTNTTYSVGDGGLTQKNFTDALKTKLEGAVMNTGDETINGRKEFSSTITGNLTGNVTGDVTGALILSNGATIQGKTVPETIPLSWIQLGGDIDGEAVGDNSGYSVSLSGNGNRVAIGAPGNDGNETSTSDNRGHVKVYELDGSTWNQLGDDIDGEAAGDESGTSVSLSDDGYTVAIGAYRNDGDSGDADDNRGHVKVYEFDGTTWNQLGDDIVGEGEGDFSGYSVSLSADGYIVAIGAYLNDDNGENSGHVKVYKFDGTTWNQLGEDIEGTADGIDEGTGESLGDNSGWSVSLSADGDIVAIGAPQHDDNRGHAKVYQFDGTTWNQLGQDIDGEAADDESGFSVSLSGDGNTLAIGAFNLGGGGGNFLDSSTGYVKVYQFDGTTWNQVGDDINGNHLDGFILLNDATGSSLSLSDNGNTLVIGAPFADDNGLLSGLARVFEYDGTQWIQIGQDIKGEGESDLSGFSVSLSGDGNTVVIGAPAQLDVSNINGNSYVRVYQKNSNTGNVDGNNTSIIYIDTSVHCDSVVMSKSAPTQSSNSGSIGEIRVDDNYIYVFTSTGWKKAQLTDL